MNKINIYKNFSFEDSIERCRNYRKRILDISQKVSALHAGGAFSCAEILDVVYYGLMRKKIKINLLTISFYQKVIVVFCSI